MLLVAMHFVLQKSPSGRITVIIHQDTHQPFAPHDLLPFHLSINLCIITYPLSPACVLWQCLHRTRAAWQNTTEVIIISDAVYNGCCAARKIPDSKLLPHFVYDVLTQISNDFQRSLYRVQCRQTLAVAVRHVRCRHGVTNLSRRNKATSASDHRPSASWVLSSAGKLIRYLHGSYFLPYYSADVFHFFFLSAISIFLSKKHLGCSLNALSSISWVDTPLTADWLQVCFGTRPRLSFLKRFWKITYPTFNCSMLQRG